MWLNLPNSLSLFRVAVVPALMVFMLVESRAGDIIALCLFLAAVASDFLDGYIARRRRQTSVLGVFLDPLADKLLVTAALVSLVQLSQLSAWVAMIVIARELAVSGLRMVAASQNLVIAASIWGKVKTTAQMVAIAALLMGPRWIEARWEVWGSRVIWYLVILMLILTVVSGVHYFVRAGSKLRGHLASSATRQSAERVPAGSGKE